jgi:hypothetical protein
MLTRLQDLFRGRDRGTVAVTFLLALPVLMLVVSIIVQYALLVNARLAFLRALDAAARSAVTTLSADAAAERIDPQANVRRAACIVLASLSPSSPRPNSDGQLVADALAATGVKIPDDFAGRYTFADEGITFTVEQLLAGGNTVPVPIDFHTRPAARVRITVSYPCRLNVPFANILIGKDDTIAGVKGRYFTFTAHVDAQLSPGRAAPTDANGQPSGSVP